jgi:hypothetical protein
MSLSDYEIALATRLDVPGILDLQDVNHLDHGAR